MFYIFLFVLSSYSSEDNQLTMDDKIFIREVGIDM